jgi:hypothetical protein
MSKISPAKLGLKAGEWIVVRSKNEILSTLDSRGCLDGLPFQPEMFAYCGKRLQVWKSAHKTCDTIKKTGGRRMENAVHLEGVRCNASAHNGCQALCLIFWKESWLRRETDAAVDAVPTRCTEADVDKAVVAPGQSPSDPDPNWVCQTTKLFEATRPQPWWDFRQYLRDVASGNHSAWHMAKILSFGAFRYVLGFGIGHRTLLFAYNTFQKLRGGLPYPMAWGEIPVDKPTPNKVLGLKQGEVVEVLPIEEILPTLNVRGMNRGMRFDQELVKYCGKRFTVDLRVERLISETDGKMLTMKSPCIQLQGVYCRGECTENRMGCPRAINSYWRENWLKRV